MDTINVCLKSRVVLVKLEINALTYREDRGKEQTDLERVWESEKVVFNYEVEKPNWHLIKQNVARNETPRIESAFAFEFPFDSFCS